MKYLLVLFTALLLSGCDSVAIDPEPNPPNDVSSDES